MEIWSSPAAYDELNGNGERGGGGGGADPIARELEEGEGSPDRLRLGPGKAAAAAGVWAPSSGGAGLGLGLVRGGRGGLGDQPQPHSQPSIPRELPPGPLGTPKVTLTPGRTVPAPWVVGSRERDGARGPPGLCVGLVVYPCRVYTVPDPAHRGEGGCECVCLRVCQCRSPSVSQGLLL